MQLNIADDAKMIRSECQTTHAKFMPLWNSNHQACKLKEKVHGFYERGGPMIRMHHELRQISYSLSAGKKNNSSMSLMHGFYGRGHPMIHQCIMS